MDMHLYDVGREDGLLEARARADETPAKFLSLSLALAVVGVIAFPWFYPTYLLGNALAGTELQFGGVVAFVVVVLAVNAWVLFQMFRRLPSLLLGMAGAVEGGYLAFREIQPLDTVWMVLVVGLGIVLGLALFVSVAEWAKRVSPARIVSA